MPRTKPAPWPPPAPSADLKRFLTSGVPTKIEAEFAARATEHRAGCVLSGSVDGVDLALYPVAAGGAPFAHLEWGDFERLTLPRKLDDRVEVDVAWPLASRVYLRQGALPLSLGKTSTLVPKLAWLAPGARVAAARAQADSARVARAMAAPPQADFEPGSFEQTLPCAELELPRHEVLFREDPALPNAGLSPGEMGELKAAAVLAEKPGGTSQVKVGGQGWPVTIHKSRNGFSLISDRNGGSWGERGFDFLGWVKSAAVRRGGTPFTLETQRIGVKPSHRACNSAELRLEPSASAAVVARLRDALPILLLEHRDDFASVLVPGLRPANDRGLWLHRDALCPLTP